MGCAESTQVFSIENQETITKEDMLPFRNSTPGFIEAVFKKFSKNKTITANGLSKIKSTF